MCSKIKQSAVTCLEYDGYKQFPEDEFIANASPFLESFSSKKEIAFENECARCHRISLIVNNDFCDVCIDDCGGL
jgi:hypothetical protein